MRLDQLKGKLSSLTPKPMRNKVRDFYYDKISFPLHYLKFKINYGSWDFFDAIALETTTYCNFRCTFCPNSKHDRGLEENKKDMDTEMFKRIVDELAAYNYKGSFFLHYYGEPLTDSRLPELVKYVRDKLPRSKIKINSNGSLLTIELYKRLIEAGINHFHITQYADIMVLNMRKLFSFLKENPDYPDKIIYRRFGENMTVYNRGGELEVGDVSDQRPICAYPNYTLQVDYNGDVLICCNDYHSSIPMGNVENEKLIDIWNKPRFKKIRSEVRNKIYNLELCKKCVGIGIEKPAENVPKIEIQEPVQIRS